MSKLIKILSKWLLNDFIVFLKDGSDPWARVTKNHKTFDLIHSSNFEDNLGFFALV